MLKITKKDIFLLILGIILTLLLEPIFLYTGRLIADSGNYFLEKLSERIIEKAALNQGVQMTIASIITLGLFLSYVYFVFKFVIPVMEEAHVERKQIDEEQIEEDKIRLQKAYKELVNTIRSFWIMSAFIILWAGFHFFIDINADNYYSSFKIEKDIISPYVTDNDIKKLNSEWRLMVKKQDYDKIIQFIDSTKKANNIIHPN